MCTLGDVACDAINPAALNQCTADPATGCAVWAPTDCTAQTGDPDAFCDASTDPNICGVPAPCVQENPMVTFTPPSLVMILDHSGSMYINDIAAGITRWDGLVQVVDQVTTNYEDRVKFGVKWFPSSSVDCNGTGNCDVTPVLDVNPALFNRNAIMAALPAFNPPGTCQTPTEQGWEQSYSALVPLVPAGESGALMLVIDGGISTTCANNTQAGAAAQIQAGFAAGFPTYVVAIDPSSSAAADANVYAAAGGVPNPDPAWDYYPGDDLAGLNDALDQIVGQIATCEIELSISPQYPNETEVFVDGVEYFQIDPALCATSDGWYYSDAPTNQRILLCGTACSTFQVVLEADVNFFCGAD
jgi:hypothetical protein